MNYELINAVGLPCPMPVVQAKKALEQPDVGCVKIKVDNYTAVQNLEKMAAGMGFEFEFDKISDSEFDAVLAKHGNSEKGQQAAHSVVHNARSAASEAVPGGSFVVAIGSDTMGRGSDELGKVLMKSFIYSLTELDTYPQAVLFFNSGAFLTSDGRGTLEDLQALADAQTKVLTCGACVDYYKLPPPAVGEITNMYEIAKVMSNAQNLINL